MGDHEVSFMNFKTEIQVIHYPDLVEILTQEKLTQNKVMIIFLFSFRIHLSDKVTLRELRSCKTVVKFIHYQGLAQTIINYLWHCTC